jgi:predicted dehydrogenase
MLKVAIVGCGKIADSHASIIQTVKGCEMVGVCDREPLMAKQLFNRFPVKRYFSDLTELLNEAAPDVVHITTSPESHFGVARRCLEHGCHVYVEKPFTVRVEEAEELIALANERGLKVTVGHDDQFSNVALRMRGLVRSGYLGGDPVHMESYYCYDLGNEAYARALLGDKNHWVRRLPGGLLHNVISHGIARIAEFLPVDSPQVLAYGFVSPFLKNLGETELVDEVRVIISGDEKSTAYFTFSSQMRPTMHLFRAYGPKNGLILDQDHEILLKVSGDRFKSYLDKFMPPVIFAKQHIGNLLTNTSAFLSRDFHMKSGMKYLINAFYRSILDGTDVPIAYREIILTARIMDNIFDQLAARRNDGEFALPSPDRKSSTIKLEKEVGLL